MHGQVAKQPVKILRGDKKVHGLHAEHVVD